MPDQIKQEFGLDVSNALNALKQLDTAMAQFEKRQATSVQAMKTFNTQAGKEVKALKLITTNANLAAAALERLNRAQGKSTTTGVAQKRQPSAVATSAEKQTLLTGAKASASMDKFMASAETRVKQNQTVWQRWAAAIRGYTSQANQATQAHGNKTAAALNNGKKALDKYLISWQTMVRVVVTQAIVRALSTLRNALRASVKDAIEFERSVAEIRTISATRNLDDLKDSVRELSDEFNVPLKTVSEGVYQTISNQVADGAEAFEFFASAARFSKVAVTDADSAVNLLSGTLNAFGKDVTETDDVAAKFFKTIELGRTRGSELAQSFGDVAPLANQLGVSLEALQAALATVTISGINTSKATTQLKGVMNGLIKPTDTMKETLKELGFESGEAIIGAYGLDGAMKLLAQQTDGTSAGLAKLFPRIRGLTAAMILSGEGSDKMVENLAKIESASAELLGQEYEFIFKTNAETITRNINKLKNVFTTELGPAIVETTNDIFNAIGGVDTIIVGFRTLGTLAPSIIGGLAGISAAYAIMTIKANAAAIAASRATIAIAPLAALAIGVTTAVAVGESAGQRIKKVWEEAIRTEEKYAKQRELIDKRLANVERRRLEESLKVHRQAFAKKNALYLKEVEAAQGTYDRQVKASTSATQRILDNYKKVAEEQLALAQKNDELIKASSQSVADAKLSQEDKIFQLKIANDEDEWKVRKLIERSSQISRDAQEKAAKAAQADDPSDAIAKARADFQRADSLISQASSIISSNKELGNQTRIYDAMNRVTDRREEGERRFRTELEKNSAAGQRLSKIMGDQIPDLTEMQAEYTELLKVVDDAGKPLDPEVIRRNGAQASRLLSKFLSKATGRDLPVSDMLDFSGVQKQLIEEISGVDIQIISATPKAINTFANELQSAVDDLTLDITIRANLESATGFDLVKNPQDATAAMEELLSRMSDLNAQERTLNGVLDKQAGIRAVIRQSIDEVVKPPGAAPTAFQDQEAWNASRVAMNTWLLEIHKLASDVNVTEKQIIKLGEAGERLKDAGGILYAPDPNAIQAGATTLQQLKEWIQLRDSATTKEALGSQSFSEAQKRIAESQREVKAAADGFNDSARTTASANEVTATATGQSKTNLVASVAPSAAIANNAERAARAYAAAAPGTTSLTAYAGRYFAAGGAARGIDTVPAMLAKNEFVINPSSSRRFYSQLQAINAGSRPVYRDSGGPVTNIGDVSINVNDSGSPQLTARAVMRAFQREQRRGSSR